MIQAESFFGYTDVKGIKTHDAPSHWPFGSIGPVTDFGFRYAPDSAVYEKQPKAKKATSIIVEEIDTEELRSIAAFSDITRFLTSIGNKP